jgi:hypothetical protein
MTLKPVFMRFKTLLISLSTITLLFGCSHSKRAIWHYKKAVKNGLELIQTADTIRINTIDSIPVVVDNKIYWEKIVTQKDTIIKYANIYIPKTRWQTRIEYRYKIRTLRQNVLKYKYIYKDKKQEKAKTNWRLFFWGLLVGFVLNFALRILDKLYNPFNK